MSGAFSASSFLIQFPGPAGPGYYIWRLQRFVPGLDPGRKINDGFLRVLALCSNILAIPLEQEQ
jgi:hypothetical protein